MEKLRIARGEEKSKKRVAFETKYPKGYNLAHDDGKGWYFAG